MNGDNLIWRIADPDPAIVSGLCDGLSLSPLLSRLLVNRGIHSPEEARRFLHPDLADLAAPETLPDMEQAVARLALALENRERILIHGDYDADGVTAAALCLRTLQALGADADVHIPSRTDGYDIQQAGVDRARELGATLILTADCGVCAIAAVDYARSLGIDVVITDHHRPESSLPAAVAVVNPYREDSTVAFRDLCGAGVAFKVMDALVERVLPQFRDSFRAASTDLVALGTVADVTPIIDDNRILVVHGLRALASCRKPGLRALLQSMDLRNKPLTAHSIGWSLGPRLNAAGRMGDAGLALRLLTTRDEKEALSLALQLGDLHERTREATSRVTTEAMVDALSDEQMGRRVLVLGRPDWTKSVVGIAASRIVEQCRRPVVLLSYDSESEHWHGSARSYGDFNLHQAFHACAPLLHRFGGHSAAAGVSLHAQHLAAFRDQLHDLAEGIIDAEPEAPALDVDAEVDGSEWDLSVLDELDSLAPFGRGNPEPVFVTRGVSAMAPRRMGADSTHFRADLRLPGRSGTLKGISFGNGAWADGIREGDEVEIAYTPCINEWNGRRAVELRLLDLRAV